MRRFLRSALVGLVATAADLGALYALVSLAGWEAVAANGPALLLGIAVQYLGNKHFAFEDRSRDPLRQVSLFAGVELGTLALNALGFHLVVTLTPAPLWLARAAVTCAVYVSFSFPMWRLVFRPSGTARPRGVMFPDR
jgi:putative flippase GtrA